MPSLVSMLLIFLHLIFLLATYFFIQKRLKTLIKRQIKYTQAPTLEIVQKKLLKFIIFLMGVLFLLTSFIILTYL